MKISLAQLNPTVGDFRSNVEKIGNAAGSAASDGADLIIYPEMSITGYPPRDLLEKQDFIRTADRMLQKVTVLSEQWPSLALLIGTIDTSDRASGKKLYNIAVLLQNGKRLFTQRKMLLPTYDVFDEARYFEPSERIEVYAFNGERLGITICEDGWVNEVLFPEQRYKVNPVQMLADKGATLLINISASPYRIGKEAIRYELFRGHAKQFNIPLIMVNQVGGNDELIFDGRSMAFDGNGDLTALLPNFKEACHTIRLGKTDVLPYTPQGKQASVYEALLLGLSDYITKCGFEKAVLGLSGGIDSALVCCLAADALGPENVTGVAMPSPFSSESSLTDARTLAENLGIDLLTIPITGIYRSYLEHLFPHFRVRLEDVTEENIQARIRGNILMALSNKHGWLTLSTGNKSELSVGYCTLYGDMSGGLSVIADVPKTLVYELSQYRNTLGPVIPESILIKAPSAELKPDQTDQDTLPPYKILDRILHLYMDLGKTRDEILSEGLDAETVDWVISAVFNNEYKRRQAAPGLKVTAKAFGSGRRMPIAARLQR